MQEENFTLEKVHMFYSTMSPTEAFNTAKQYIDKYFIPLTDGSHAMLTNGSYNIIDDVVIKKTYFKRMPAELTKYYFTEKIDLKCVIYSINKPVLFENYLNLCPRIKQIYKKPEEFSKRDHDRLQIILKYILELLCSNNEKACEFLLKWLANMVRGNRNQSALYFKGPQGAGKSSLLEFLRKHVIGNDLCYQGGSGPLKGRFNSELSGKLMTVFEELETFSVSEWMAVSSVLKRKITSPTIMIERKGCDAREETNLNNDILISNNDAIQDDDGRRYFILDISTRYIGDEKYFNRLHSCFDDNMGQLFYSYLLDIDLTNYNSQRYPVTNSKKDSYAKRLDNVYKFLKDTFILKKRGIERVLVADLFDGYLHYCRKIDVKAKGKIEFNKTLSDINIKYKPSNGQNVYKVSYDKLLQIANKFHWLHSLDEYVKKDEEEEEKAESMFVNKEDKAVCVRIEDHNDIIYKQNEKIEMLQESNDDMLGYIRQLELLVGKLSKENDYEDDTESTDEEIECISPPKKNKMPPINPKPKVYDNFDFVEIAKGVYYNSKTNTTHEKASDSELLDDDGVF